MLALRPILRKPFPTVGRGGKDTVGQ